MKKAFVISTFLGAAFLAGCSHPQPAYYPPPPPPLNLQAIEAQGEHDGFEAAKHDVETNQPPIFDHHPRYRNPPVPGPGWPAYRQGFRRGYERFLHPGPGGPPPAPRY